jgi:hypothetical protein
MKVPKTITEVKIAKVVAAPVIDQVTYKLWMQRIDAFRTMLRTAIEGNPKFTPTYIISKYWDIAFDKKPFPEKGGTIHELSLAIEYELCRLAFAYSGMPISERFTINHTAAVSFQESEFYPETRKLYTYMAQSEQSQKIIFYNPNLYNQEEPMSTKSKKTADGKEQKKATLAPKADKKATPAKKPAPAAKEKKTTGGDPDRAMAVARKKHAADLVVAQRSTDEEIVEACTKKFPECKVPFINARVAALRYDMNAGLYAGIPEPKVPYEKIVLDGKTKVPASKAPHAEKKTAKPKYTKETDPLAKHTATAAIAKTPKKTPPSKAGTTAAQPKA